MAIISRISHKATGYESCLVHQILPASGQRCSFISSFIAYLFYGLAEASTQNSMNAMKAQAEAVSQEYDRLMKEHEKLQKQVEGSGDKKGD